MQQCNAVTIVGVGAMGCLFAGRLHPLADVTLLGHWPEQIATLRQTGLQLVDPAGHSQLIPVQVSNNPAELPPADLALILVKSYQTAQAAKETAQFLAADGLALTLQNGLGNFETLTACLGPGRVALGVTTQGATLLRPGVVREGGAGPIHLAQAPKMEAVANLLRAAGFESHLSGRVDSLVWGKLAINAAINPLTAILGVPNGFLAENEVARRLMGQIAEEVAALAQAQAIPLPFPSASQRALEVAQATAANFSSMLQDLSSGRETEIEAICGAVVRSGREHGRPTPLNEALLATIKKLQTTAGN